MKKILVSAMVLCIATFSFAQTTYTGYGVTVVATGYDLSFTNSTNNSSSNKEIITVTDLHWEYRNYMCNDHSSSPTACDPTVTITVDNGPGTYYVHVQRQSGSVGAIEIELPAVPTCTDIDILGGCEGTVQLCGDEVRVTLTGTTHNMVSLNNTQNSWTPEHYFCLGWNPGPDCAPSSNTLIYTPTTSDIYEVQFHYPNDPSNPCKSATFTMAGGQQRLASTSAIDDTKIAPAPEVILSPNPVRNELSIQVDGDNTVKSVALFSISGTKVAEYQKAMPTIDMSEMAKGIYFLILDTENGRITKRFVKN